MCDGLAEPHAHPLLDPMFVTSRGRLATGVLAGGVLDAGKHPRRGVIPGRDWMDTSSHEVVGALFESSQNGHRNFRERTQLTLVADDASPSPELLIGAIPRSSSPEDVIAPVNASLE